MDDKRAQQESTAKRVIPFLLAAVFAILALFSSGGWVSAVLVILAFLVGYLPAEKTLFFVAHLEDQRSRARDTLHRLDEADIARILEIIRAGRKIEAIKELRAIHRDGLKEAKEAVELLEDFGLKWRGSVDQPPK